MDNKELKRYLSEINCSKVFHYFTGKNKNEVMKTVGEWLKITNFDITLEHKIEQRTQIAVKYSLSLFEKFWQNIGAIETGMLKKYVFACYSLVMKYMFDYIDSDVMFRVIGYRLTNNDIVEAEFKIMDVMNWKIII